MRSAWRTRRVVLVLLGALVGAAAGTVATEAASGKADYSIAVSPASATAPQGGTATYTVSITAVNGFSSSVALSASSLPSGVTASFSPTTASKSQSSTLLLSVASSVAPGTYPNLQVNGTGGSAAHFAPFSLVVTSPPPPPGFTVSADPPTQSMLPGGSTSYTVNTAATNGFTGSIALAVTSGLPTGATASFSPASVAVGGASTLTISSKSNTASGNYTVGITGTSGARTVATSVGLSLQATGKAFTIALASPVPSLSPGATRPIDLTFTNTNNQPLAITGLSVGIQSVTKAAGVSSSLPCTVSDYSVSQFSGSYSGLTVPANGTAQMSRLVSDSTKWPQLTMLDSAANQDGCKGATVYLTFSGTGQGA